MSAMPPKQVAAELFDEVKRLQEENAKLRAAALAILKDEPMVECNNFSHTKTDYHRFGFNCPVCARWTKALAQLRALATP